MSDSDAAPAPQQPARPPALSPSNRSPRATLTRTKRTDNFLKSVGEGAIWAMDETALAACLQNSELMEMKPKDCAPLLEKMRCATGLDLVSTDACLEEQEKPPWVRAQRNHEREMLKGGDVTFAQVARLRNFLNHKGIGYAALLYRSCHQHSPLMDYRFVSLRGEGGYGVVYEVANRNLPDGAPHVALKLIKVKHDDEEGTQEEIDRAAREMSHHQRAAASSRYVVDMHTWGQIDDEFFFVAMELCEDGDVEKLLNEQPGRGLEAGLLWRLYEQLALGLKAIHDAGLIHLDLKPANCAFRSRS